MHLSGREARKVLVAREECVEGYVVEGGVAPRIKGVDKQHVVRPECWARIHRRRWEQRWW